MMPRDWCQSVFIRVLSASRQLIRQPAAATHRVLNAISWRHGIRSCTPTPHQKTSRFVRPTSPSWRVVTLAPTQGFYGRMVASAELTWPTNGIARFQVCKIQLGKYAVNRCHGDLQHTNSITAKPVAVLVLSMTAVIAMDPYFNTKVYIPQLPDMGCGLCLINNIPNQTTFICLCGGPHISNSNHHCLMLCLCHRQNLQSNYYQAA